MAKLHLRTAPCDKLRSTRPGVPPLQAAGSEIAVRSTWVQKFLSNQAAPSLADIPPSTVPPRNSTTRHRVTDDTITINFSLYFTHCLQTYHCPAPHFVSLVYHHNSLIYHSSALRSRAPPFFPSCQTAPHKSKLSCTSLEVGPR